MCDRVGKGVFLKFHNFFVVSGVFQVDEHKFFVDAIVIFLLADAENVTGIPIRGFFGREGIITKIF